MLDDERDGYTEDDLTESFTQSFEQGRSCTCEAGEFSHGSCELCG